MKSWRERISEARARGAFTADDRAMWTYPDRCFVGEMRQRYGLDFNLEMTKLSDVESACGPLQEAIQHAINYNDFDEAERLLDHVEDRALTLKRGAQP